MKFSDAMEHMQRGHRVKYSKWPENHYVYIKGFNMFTHDDDCDIIPLSADMILGEWELISSFDDGLYMVKDHYCIRFNSQWWSWDKDKHDWLTETILKESGSFLYADYEEETELYYKQIQSGKFNPSIHAIDGYHLTKMTPVVDLEQK